MSCNLSCPIFPTSMAPKASWSWWQNLFCNHPGLALKHEDTYHMAPGGTTKVNKVYCTACLGADVAELSARGEGYLGLGWRNHTWSSEEIKTYHMLLSLLFHHLQGHPVEGPPNIVWSIQKGYSQQPDTEYGFIHYTGLTLINHSKTCPRQSEENRGRAWMKYLHQGGHTVQSQPLQLCGH